MKALLLTIISTPSVTVLASDSQKGLEIMQEIYREINAPIEITEVNVAGLLNMSTIHIMH
ncbi:MAG: hypothetical protein MZW92_21645 [Comamonadaceae bacterium]|nr:hypothetical protein [Comamonadaceae bacterium]